MSCFGCCNDDGMQRAADNGQFTGYNTAGGHGGYHATEAVPKDTKTVEIQPIAVPTISVDELKEITDSFGTKALIGEGSYGRVYYGLLKSGHAAAIKKLDSSKQPDQEFLAQVSMVSRLKNENVDVCAYIQEGVPTSKADVFRKKQVEL